jgi:hypothetical protein
MDMGMVEQILPPSVEHGKESDFRTQMRRICGDDTQRLSGGTEKNVVDDSLVVKGYCGDLFGQRKDDMEI